MILKEFFINFCVLCTSNFLIHEYFRRDQVAKVSLLKRGILVGFIQGLFGVLLMQFGIHLEGGVLIDLRSVPMMIAAQVGGWVSVSVATIMIIASRLVFYPGSLSTLVNIIVLSLTAIAFWLISRSHLKINRKWLLMTFSFLVILACSINFVIPNVKQAMLVFVQYALAISVGAASTYGILSYLWRNDANYEKLKEIAQTDFLTGLNNVRSFDTAFSSAYVKAMEHQEELSLLVIDVDLFKEVNDTYGHPSGDKILVQIGQILLKSCRSVDIVSRNGGEEFSIIMPACDGASAKRVAKRILRAVEQSMFILDDHVQIKVTVSIGQATANSKNPVSAAELIDQADKGLYLAKQSGRNRIGYFAVGVR